MGMYTGLRGTVKLNDIGQVMADMEFDWALSGIDAIQEFSSDHRASFIPFGVHAYMPDSWGDRFSKVDGDTWSFSCSLKNYDSTIEKFVSGVLPLIGSSWSLEMLYEEDDTPTAIIKEEV